MSEDSSAEIIRRMRDAEMERDCEEFEAAVVDTFGATGDEIIEALAALARVEALAAELDAEAATLERQAERCDRYDQPISAGRFRTRAEEKRDAAARLRAALTGKETQDGD